MSEIAKKNDVVPDARMSLTESSDSQTGAIQENVTDLTAISSAEPQTHPKKTRPNKPSRLKKPAGPVRDSFRLVFHNNFSRDMIAGLPNEGFTFESISPQDNPDYDLYPSLYDNRYTLRAGGLVTGQSDWQYNPAMFMPATDYSVGLEYTRLQRIEDPHREIYKSVGPRVGLTYNTARRNMQDRGVQVTMDTSQLQDVFGNATQDAVDLLNTDTPDIAGYDDASLIVYGLQLQDWLDDNMNAFEMFPYVFRTMFNDYDLSRDISSYVYASPKYPVRTHELNAAIGVGQEFRNYSVPVNAFNSGYLSFEGSYLHFAGRPYQVNDYLGVGAQFEASVLSLNLGKPVGNWLPPTLDLQVQGGFDFYWGITRDGLSDKSLMGTVNIGAGLRLAIPPPKKEWVEGFGRGVDKMARDYENGERLEPMNLGNVDF